MKITTDYLKSIDASSSMIARFSYTPELHDIDMLSEVTTGDKSLFNDINWLINKLKGKLPVSKLTFKNSSGYTMEYTYDERGNKLTFKNSTGYAEEYTYDERGNKLTFKNSNGYSSEYTYDERGNKLTYKNSDGNIIADYTQMKYDLTDFEIR